MTFEDFKRVLRDAYPATTDPERIQATAEVCYELYLMGVDHGLRAFSWMKDGTTYVGTCGTTLKEAQKMAREGKLVC